MKNIVERIKYEYNLIVEGMLVSCGILNPCPVKVEIEAEDDDTEE